MSSPNILLGLGGYIRSGKDSVATILEKGGWQRTAMASPVEKALLKLNPWVPVPGRLKFRYIRYSELHAEVGYDESKTNLEVRRLLQVLGTSIGREMFGYNSWVDMAEKFICSALVTSNVAITGIRFSNEIEMLRRHGGIIAWVDRGVPSEDGHVSENSVLQNEFDYTIANHGSLDDLSETVGDFISMLRQYA